MDQAPFGSVDGRLPLLPEPPTALDRDPAQLLADLRRFHRSERGKADTRAPSEYLPAQLQRFRDPAKLRSGDFPLYVFPPGSDERVCAPLADLLREKLEFSGQKDRARILADNLLRVERQVRWALDARRESGQAGPADADAVLAEVGESLLAELGLNADHSARLRADYEALVEQLPRDGALIDLTPNTALRLLLAAVEQHRNPRRDAFRAELEILCRQLAGLLDIEHQKEPDARAPDALSHAVGSTGARFVDPAALAAVVGPHRGTQVMAPERRQRIEATLATLSRHLDAEASPLMTVLHGNAVEDSAQFVLGESARLVASPAPCTDAVELFDRQARDYTDLFRAARTARLELAGQFVAELHEPWLEELDWQGFSRDELQLLPPVVAIESADRLAREGLLALSRLLASGRPVQVLVLLDPGQYPGALDGQAALQDFRLELGYLGIGHREALVLQSTAARPEHLVHGFLAALDGTRTALQVVTSELDASGRSPRLGAWLHAGAALEARAHPIYRYDPEAGVTWKSRLDFTGNPEPEADWPTYPLEHRTPTGEEASLTVAFTFADFALLEPGYAAHFQPVPDGFDDPALTPVADYLALDAEATVPRLPFVWAVGADAQLCRLAITRRLAEACRDRLHFWRTLQELAGVRNEHALLAAEQAREAARAEAHAEVERLAAEHAAELERVRQTAVGEAMRGLAQMLLNLDQGLLGAAASPLPPRSTSAPAEAAPDAESAPAEAAPETAAAPEAPVEEEAGFDEPWIDTPLCTSCNDCTALNGKLFVYDENKQAMIGDPRAGTYAQLVAAAEKCPAKCIHPGKPLDPNEPNLEELTRRAAAFN